MPDRPHVLILGGGFAGVGALNKLAGKHVQVTVIDQNDFHTFLPLLYQVATAELGPDEVGFPLAEMVDDDEGWEFLRARVTGIDLAAKTVTAEGSAPVPYDYLILGLGAVVNFFGTKGTPENAFPLYNMSDALRLKEHILGKLAAAEKDTSVVDDGALTFCVVGGGATGVETAGALAELLHIELKSDYPDLPLERTEVRLYEMGPVLLAPFKPHLQEYAKTQLEDRGVQVHLGEGVVAVEPTRVHLKSGEAVRSHTLVWGAGLKANPLGDTLGEQEERGRVIVGPDLSLPDHPEVFVVGDIALITDTKTGDKLPQLGSVALQSGEHAGENIARLVGGKKTEPFEYTDKGTMATIGRGAAVVEFKRGKTMTGHAAWVAWLGVHLMLLSGGKQKGLTFLNWGWDILSQGRGKRIDVD